jgi:hypothetical protein
VEGEIGRPLLRNVRFSNVRMKDVTTLAEVIKVAPEKPLLGLSLTNISGNCKKGITLVNVRDAILKGIKATGFSGPLLSIENTRGVVLKNAAEHQ